MIKVLHITSDYEPNSLWGMGKSVYNLQRYFSRNSCFNIHIQIATVSKSGNVHSDIVTSKKEIDRKLLSSDRYSIFNNFNNFLKWNEHLAEEIIKIVPFVDIIHCHNWMSWLTSCRIQKHYGCKIVSSCHFLQKQYNSMIENPILSCHKQIINIENKMLKHSDAIVVFTKIQKKFLIHKYNIRDTKKIYVISHPINNPTIKNKGKHKKSNNARHVSVVFVGRVTRDKGIESLVDVVKGLHKKYSTLTLKIIGSNELGEAISKQPNFIKLIGSVPNNQVFKMLLSGDIFCLPSISESFGMAVAEAMFCGLPIITCSGNNNPMLFTNNKSGLYCPLIKKNNLYNVNKKCLYNKLDFLIRNPSIRKKMGKCAKQEASAKYSVRKILKKYSDLYKSLI
jgi:glycosyltransferase involved in cell wall biosynthesis